MKIKEKSIVKPQPTLDLLSEEEDFWNVKLPNDYKKFLINYNGGIPEQNSFIVHSRTYAIDRFLCVLEESDENVESIYDIDVILTRIEERLTANEDLVGVELLPIAILFNGDYVCLEYKNVNKEPRVCIWNHEESGELNPVTYHVANNFNEWINSLR